MNGIEDCPILICMCSDNNGVDFMLVAIKSIFITNRDENIDLHIVTDGFSEENLARISELEEHFNRKIIVHQIDASQYRDMPGCGNGFFVPKGTCFRFSIPDVIPEAHKVLYLDTDVIVERSLRELWETDISGYAAAVVLDPGEYTKYGDHIYVELGFAKDRYFNAGVILMNLDYFRENNVGEKCIKWLLDNPDKAKFVDQTALNIILRDKVKYLPTKFNLQFDHFVSYEGNEYGSEPEGIREAREMPVIIHYTILKPWFRIGIKGLPRNKERFEYYRRQNPATKVEMRNYKGRLRRKIFYMLYRLGLTTRTPSLVKNVVGLDRGLKKRIKSIT